VKTALRISRVDFVSALGRFHVAFFLLWPNRITT